MTTSTVHQPYGWTTITFHWLSLLVLHILGALKHFLVDGDQVFIGMLISNRED